MSAHELVTVSATELKEGDRVVITESKRKFYRVTGTFKSLCTVELWEGYTVQQIELTGVKRCHNEMTYRNRASAPFIPQLAIDTDNDRTIRRYPTKDHM